MQSVPITNKVVSSNPIHVEVYSIQHYVIKFVSDLQQVSGFLRIHLHIPTYPPTYIGDIRETNGGRSHKDVLDYQPARKGKIIIQRRTFIT